MSSKRKRDDLVVGPSSLTPNVGDRYFWDGSDGVTLNDWLNAVRPSSLSERDCSWIQVKNAVPSSPGYSSTSDEDDDDEATFREEEYSPILEEITTKIEKGDRIPKKEKQRSVERILDVAKRQRCTVGKWMLFVKPEAADETWESVAKATAAGKLGSGSKISPAKGSDSVVVCVYVEDCTRKDEVRRVLDVLKKDMGFDVRAGFKPDVYTYLGIYRENPWRLEPTLYSVAEVSKW